MSDKQKCPVCEVGALAPQQVLHAANIRNAVVEVPQRRHVCEHCGTIQATDDDLRFNARAMRKAAKERRNMLSGEAVREVRERLRLTQEQAAALFGGGPVAFSKYENDDVAQSESMDRLIWLASEYPWLVGVLSERCDVTLSEESLPIIESSRSVYRAEYLAQARERTKSARIVLQGFHEHIRAGNDDEIYSPDQGATTTLRRAA
jgi:HTH-type transcriptional regulator/antitoxin MqsA